MQFSHTIDEVLAGEQTQTSRIWKDNYILDESERYIHWVQIRGVSTKKIGYVSIRSRKTGKLLYHTDQILSVQSARGAKGVAKIRILELAKRDVRSFTEEDIAREGFETRLDFYVTWYYMHFPEYVKFLAQELVTPEWWLDAIRGQIPEKNTALVIRFELVKD